MTKKLAVSLGYPSMGNISRLLESAGAIALEWSYAEEVSVTGEVPVSEYERVARELEELKARGIISQWQ